MIWTQYDWLNKFNNLYHIAGKFGGEKFGELTLFEHLGNKKFSELVDQPIGH